MRGGVNVNGFKLTTKHGNINSKPLFNVVNDFIMECLERLAVFRRSNDQTQQNVYDGAHDFMSDLIQDDKIETYQVICDIRNNSEDFKNSNGFFAITIKYRQRHCLNITTLDYKMWKNYDGKNQP